MKVVFGLKAHSGWAALVVIGRQGGEFVVVDRRRLELVEHEWAKQPYHAAEGLEAKEAGELVKHGIEAARKIARRELKAAVKREKDRGNEVAACAVLVGNPLPDWSVDQILAVHFRMHQAEGVLFRDVLIEAAKACELKLITLPEKTLVQDAEKLLRSPSRDLARRVATMGKSAGPPWGKDQKDATLAALVAFD